MKLLIMPGLPLLFIILTVLVPDSKAASIANMIAFTIFSLGGAFVIIFAVARYFIRHNLH